MEFTNRLYIRAVWVCLVFIGCFGAFESLGLTGLTLGAAMALTVGLGWQIVVWTKLERKETDSSPEG